MGARCRLCSATLSYQASGKHVRKFLMDERFANVPWAWAAAMQMENAESTRWILSGNRHRRPASAFKDDAKRGKGGSNMSKHHFLNLSLRFKRKRDEKGIETAGLISQRLVWPFQTTEGQSPVCYAGEVWRSYVR